jgi:MFS transporter, MHS family, proline/betaine transporter
LSVIFLVCQLLLRGEEHKDELKEFKSESNSTEISDEKRIPLAILLKEYKQSTLSIIILSTITSSLYYLVITYFVTFTVEIKKLPMSDALEINAVSLVSLCICVPIFGLISDYVGRKLSLVFSMALFLGVSVPVLALLRYPDYMHIMICCVLLAMLTACVQGVATPFYTEIFPKNVRASGCSVGYGIGVGIAGFAPMIATIFEKISFSGINYFFYSLLIIGLITALLIPYKHIERKRLKNLKVAGVAPINIFDITGNKKKSLVRL